MEHVLVVDDDAWKRAIVLECTRAVLGDGVMIHHASDRFNAEKLFAVYQPRVIFVDGSFPRSPVGQPESAIGVDFVQRLIHLGYQGIMVAFSGDKEVQARLVAEGCQYELSPQTMGPEVFEKIFTHAGLLLPGGP